MKGAENESNLLSPRTLSLLNFPKEIISNAHFLEILFSLELLLQHTKSLLYLEEEEICLKPSYNKSFLYLKPP